MKKRIVCIMLSLLLMAGLVPQTMAAEEDRIEIRTAEDLIDLANHCQLDTWSADKEVVLLQDIDLAGTEFTPIPLFMGHFDGQDHTISGFSMLEDASVTGFFRKVLEEGIVENLHIEGDVRPLGHAEKAGGIAGENHGTIQNCTFSGNVEGSRQVGGIVGLNDETGGIDACTVSGTMVGEHSTGGIAGENKGTISNCTNTATINDAPFDDLDTYSTGLLFGVQISEVLMSAEELIDVTDAGGIAGLCSGKVTDCRNTGSIGYPSVGYNIGGIVGYLTGAVQGCTNAGEVKGRKDVGGVVGQMVPEAKWEYTANRLSELNANLDALQSLIDVLLNDIRNEQGGLSGQLSAILDAVENAENATQEASDATTEWINNNLKEVDKLFEGVEQISNELSYAASNAASRIRTSIADITLDEENPEAAFEALTQILKDNESVLQELLNEIPDGSGLSFEPVEMDGSASEALIAALTTVRESMESLPDAIGDTTLTDDFQGISNQLFNLINFFTGLAEEIEDGTPEVVLEDISTDSETMNARIVRDSVNEAEIKADTNVGGIVGAVTLEIDFDQEDELNLSSVLSGRARYLVSAVVSGCRNTGNISAKKEAAGGIAGRMDYGAVLDSAASGTISCEGEYAGGIVGYSLATIARCHARVNVSAENYTGGIAGLGHDILRCLAMPYLEKEAELTGSIAGDADGTITGNYYGESADGTRPYGAINGFSYAEKAQSATYEELLEMAEEENLFRTVTITFTDADEDTVIERQEIPFGGQVETFPRMPDREEKIWKWEDFDNEDIRHSITVTGSYISPLTTLATKGEIPDLLVEGTFYEAQELQVTDADAALTEALKDRQILAADEVTVTQYTEDLTVRLHAETDGDLYVFTDTVKKQSYEKDGSYIVFTMPNGASFAWCEQEDKPNYLLYIGIGLGAAIIVAGIILLIHKKRKTYHKKTAG